MAAVGIGPNRQAGLHWTADGASPRIPPKPNRHADPRNTAGADRTALYVVASPEHPIQLLANGAWSAEGVATLA
jgi:hypothetical protein